MEMENIVNRVRLSLVREDSFDYNKILNSSSEVVEFVNSIMHYDTCTTERVVVIGLDNKLRIVGFSEIGIGDEDICNVNRKVLFKTLLLMNANSFILVHNHPSGITKPSNADINCTRNLKKCADMLDLKMLDHQIIGENGKHTSVMEYIED